MRIALALLAACALAACTTTSRTRASRVPEGEAAAGPAAAAARPSAPSDGPMQAEELARENGLRYADQGSSVLLSEEGLLLRIFPGSDRLSVNGLPSSMGETARRNGPDVLVPVTGVRRVRRETAELRRKRAAALAAVRPVVPPILARSPSVALPPPPSARTATTDAAPAAWRPAAAERKWQWIVIHHSDDTCGSAAKYEAVHRGKGWDGLGYHFVIGNGSQSGDGAVEVGYRWTQQEHGAHARQRLDDDNRFNEFGIGVVLVGDFEYHGGPSRAQYLAVVRLTRWLMARYAITPDRVLRHNDVKPTCCPGRGFPWSRFLSDVSAPPATPGD